MTDVYYVCVLVFLNITYIIAVNASYVTFISLYSSSRSLYRLKTI